MQTKRKILIVDDTLELLDSLVAFVGKSMKDVDLLKAFNGVEAVDILSKEDVSLLITDVKMPQMDGLALLAHVSEHHPELPCIVMTAYGKPDILKDYNQNSCFFLEKPFDFDKLVINIREIFDAMARDSIITGVSLGSFLQLLSLEESTCLIKVASESGEWGGVYIRNGEVYDAIINGFNGEEALYKMLSWKKAGISYRQLPDKKLKRRIFKDVVNLVLEGMRRKDEQKQDDDDDEHQPERNLDYSEEDMPELFDEHEPLGELEDLEDDGALEQESGEAAQEASTPTKHLKEESKMALDNYLKELSEINGYKASAIMNFTGEILQSHTSDSKVDLAVVGATFNDIFRQAHDASKKVGLDACNESTITTPNGMIIMRCSGINEKVHFHTITVLSKDGNQALIKMKMEKMMPGIMNELA